MELLDIINGEATIRLTADDAARLAVAFDIALAEDTELGDHRRAAISQRYLNFFRATAFAAAAQNILTPQQRRRLIRHLEHNFPSIAAAV